LVILPERGRVPPCAWRTGGATIGRPDPELPRKPNPMRRPTGLLALILLVTPVAEAAGPSILPVAAPAALIRTMSTSGLTTDPANSA